MFRIVAVGAAVLFMLSAGNIQEQFHKYKKIEAYEVRPGVLMLPSYAQDGKVCEIGLQKLQYSPELVRVDPGLSRKEIDEIFDELVPVEERGKPSNIGHGRAIMTLGGQSLTTTIDFENVSIQIFGATLPSARKGQIAVEEAVATVKWKHRTCR